MSDIRTKMEHLCRGFIHDAEVVDNNTMTYMRLVMQESLQQMCNDCTIQNSRIYDVTRPDGLPTFEIVIQPTLTVEYMVVNLIINP